MMSLCKPMAMTAECLLLPMIRKGSCLTSLYPYCYERPHGSLSTSTCKGSCPTSLYSYCYERSHGSLSTSTCTGSWPTSLYPYCYERPHGSLSDHHKQASQSLIKKTLIQLICECKVPDTGCLNVQCDNCNDELHRECVNLNQSIHDSTQYLCPKCKEQLKQ